MKFSQLDKGKCFWYNGLLYTKTSSTQGLNHKYGFFYVLPDEDVTQFLDTESKGKTMNTTLVKFCDVEIYQRFQLSKDSDAIYEKIAVGQAQNTDMLDSKVLELFSEKRVYLITENISSPSMHSVTVSNIIGLRRIPVVALAAGWLVVMVAAYLIGVFYL